MGSRIQKESYVQINNRPQSIVDFRESSTGRQANNVLCNGKDNTNDSNDLLVA